MFKISHHFPISIRDGMESNEALRARFSSAASAALEDVDNANKNLLSSVDRECPAFIA